MKKSTKTIVVVVTIGLFLALGVGIAYGADRSKPGDLLHPIDKAMEDVRRAVTIRPASKTQLEMDVLDERLDELDKIATELSKKTGEEPPDTAETETITPPCSANEIQCWKKITNDNQSSCRISTKCYVNRDICPDPWVGEELTCDEEPDIPPEEPDTPPEEPDTPPEEPDTPPEEPDTPPEEPDTPPEEPDIPPEEPDTPPEEPDTPPEEPDTPPEEPDTPPEEPDTPPEEPDTPPEEPDTPPGEPSTPNEQLVKTTNPIARFLFLTHDASNEEFEEAIAEAVGDIATQQSRVEEELEVVGEEYAQGSLDRLDECLIIKRITEEMDRQLTTISYLSDTMASYDYDDEAYSLYDTEQAYASTQNNAIEVFLED